MGAVLPEGVAETAQGAVATARKLAEIAGRTRQDCGPGRRAGSAALITHAAEQAGCTIPRLAKRTKLTLPTVAKALDVLAELGVRGEIPGKKRHRSTATART